MAEISVIAGGTSGIGAAIARQLAVPGAVLVLGYLQNRGRAQAIANELHASGAEIVLVEGNIADAATRETLAVHVRAAGNVCHRLVHSVAVTSFKPLLQVKPNQWSVILDVSTRSLLDLVREFELPLRAAKGSVLAISSGGATRAVPAYGALGPAKAALEAVVRQLASELGPDSVRVNAIRAGLIEGEIVARFPAPFRDAILARTPLGRLGAPDDVAGAAGFLLSREASWITGQVLEVDGGFSVS